MKHFLIVLCLGVFLPACGPVYQMQYSYHPPATAEGKTCALQCENNRQQCVQNEDLKLQNCEIRNRMARLEYQHCLDIRGNKANDCYEDSEICYSNRQYCPATYHRCYEACGGQVSSQRVCVSACDEAEK